MTRPKKKPPLSSLEQAIAQVALIDTKIREAEAAQVPPEKMIGLVREKRMAGNSLARLRGDIQRVNERTILKSPAWRRIEKAMGTALIPFPEAAKAIAAALNELEAREDG